MFRIPSKVLDFTGILCFLMRPLLSDIVTINLVQTGIVSQCPHAGLRIDYGSNSVILGTSRRIYVPEYQFFSAKRIASVISFGNLMSLSFSRAVG
jgi:hypothetical protein